MAFYYEKYIRNGKLPHIWCPGCGIGIVMKSILRGIDKLNLDKNKVAFVSGIGCTSRMPGYLDFNTLHTTHGRALTFATGLKHARKDLTVIARRERVRVRVSGHWNRRCPGPLTHALSPLGERECSGRAGCKGISITIH